MSIKLNSILVCGMYGMVLIDMLTGAILINNPEANITPGLIYKLLLLPLLYYFLPRLGVKVFVANVVLLSTTILSSILTGYFSVATNIIAVTKLLIFITFFYYLQFLLKNEIITSRTIYRISLFTFGVIVINQVFGLLGFGKPTYLFYGVPVGTSGFFFEHNATGIILTIAVAIIYLHLRNKSSLKKTFLFLALGVIIGFSFATKTAILGTLMIFSIGLLEKKRSYLPIVAVIFVVIVITNWDKIQQMGQVAKVIQDVNVNSTSGLLSGRAERHEKCVDDYFVQFSFVDKLIGIGHYRMLNDKEYGVTAEIDYIDVLKMSGIVGFIVCFIPFISITISSYCRYKKNKHKAFLVVVFLNIVFLAVSSTAGHLFTSGSVNFYLALLNIYPYFSSKESEGNELVGMRPSC